ncbi:acetoacetate decarboxylase family protein [Nocardioides sp.]|uniref:acetoacetate decarboxylase family protein n=1 Tax=Nocardioides sp. TaxID=35761 RepID=UPI0035687E2E
MTSQIAWVESLHAPVSYPAAPWQMVGSMWVSIFRLSQPVDAQRPAGIYGAAFVSYEEGSPLTYSELLVARPIRTAEGRRVNITDIWVDSPESEAGGRELWAIPKELCDFSLDSEHRGPVSTTEWSARLGQQPIAHARFRDVSRLAPRAPFTAATWQEGIKDTEGQPRSAVMKGTTRALPCRAHWDFNPDGPLGWLAGARQLGSLRQLNFRMSFG